MIRANIKIFQIRIKNSFSSENIKMIKRVKTLCDFSNCILILNDNINLSKDLDLDGVHIGSTDSDIVSARKILGEEKIIGVSCYNDINLGIFSENSGATYVSFGSMYKTTTKLNAVNLDIKTIYKASKMINIPICIIGGISADNVHDVINLNCDLIAISKGLSSINELNKISKIYYEKN